MLCQQGSCVIPVSEDLKFHLNQLGYEGINRSKSKESNCSLPLGLWIWDFWHESLKSQFYLGLGRFPNRPLYMWVSWMPWNKSDQATLTFIDSSTLKQPWSYNYAHLICKMVFSTCWDSDHSTPNTWPKHQIKPGWPDSKHKIPGCQRLFSYLWSQNS